MRIVFFGTSTFAVPALTALQAEYGPLTVVTQPDRPAGRGHRLTPTPVRLAADEAGLEVLMPERFDAAFASKLQELRPELFVVVSYGRIVPQALLDLPSRGAYNIHPSLLPLYRGATPIPTAIRDGRIETGVTIIAMDAGMDTGPILRQERYPIEADEIGSQLHDRLAVEGARLILETVGDALAERLAPQRQQSRIDSGECTEEEVRRTMTRPLRAEDLALDWTWSSRRIADAVRAYAERPAARGSLGTERCKILATAPAALRSAADEAAAPGSVLYVEGGGVVVRCGDGAVAVTRVIPPGRPLQSGGDVGRRLLTREGKGVVCP